MARWLLAVSRPDSLPCLGAESRGSWLPHPPFPQSCNPRSDPFGLCLTPGNTPQETVRCLVSSHPSGQGGRSGPSVLCHKPKPAPWASHSPRQASARSSSHCVACLGQWFLLSRALGSQVSLQACNRVLPLLFPSDVPRGCLLSRMQYSAASQGGVPPSSPSRGFSSQKRAPTQAPLFLVDRQGVCMRVHAVGDGAASVPRLPSALLLPSDCDHCPCCLL